MKEELDMLFLLEHFSLEDLVKAEEEFINYQFNNTDNLKEFSYENTVSFDDGSEYTETIVSTYIDF